MKNYNDEYDYLLTIQLISEETKDNAACLAEWGISDCRNYIKTP